MQNRAWWDAAVAATVVVCALLIWIDAVQSSSTGRATVGASLALAAFAAAYAVFGRWVRPARHPVAAGAYLVVMVVATGIGCAEDPNLAVLQVVAYPLIGCFASGGLVGMLVWDALLGSAVFGGLLAATGSIVAAAITAVLSFVFAAVIGVWITRITKWGEERARLLAEVQSAQERAASAARETGAALERERLARDMHDTVAQSLTGLVMLAERAQRQASTADGRPELAETLGTIEDAARETLHEIRALVAESAAPPVEDGLGNAARRVATRFERETGIGVTIDFIDIRLDREHEVVLLRCLQEALANVRKHSKASSATAALRLEPGADAGADAGADTGTDAGTDAGTGVRTDAGMCAVVRLVVTDNGVGIGRDYGVDDGFGLAGMRDRLRSFGGDLTLNSVAGGGASLAVSVPVRWNADSDRPSVPVARGASR